MINNVGMAMAAIVVLALMLIFALYLVNLGDPMDGRTWGIAFFISIIVVGYFSYDKLKAE